MRIREFSLERVDSSSSKAETVCSNNREKMNCRHIKRQNVQFIAGLCLGLSLTVVLRVFDATSSLVLVRGKRYNFISSADIQQLSRSASFGWLSRDEVADDFGNETVHDDGAVKSDGRVREYFEDKHQHHDDDTIARQLFADVRVACWIMTSPDNLDRKAVHVKNTWAKRCNKVFFMSSVSNDSFPTIGLNVSEGREHLTAKTMKAFQYLYTNHLQDADWFLKADDDTFIIMENLRYFLSNEDPQEPVYFGQRFKPLVKQGYPSGGGGYVLSREALRRFGSEGVGNPKLCAVDKGAEDVQMGKCLQNLGVRLKPSIDVMGRTRFHCFSPETMLQSSFPKWYQAYDYEGAKGGIENISDYAVSFHYVPADKMYALEFYTYHLQPYGILSRTQELNVKL